MRGNKGRTERDAGDHECLCSVDYREQRLKGEVESAAQKLLNLGFECVVPKTYEVLTKQRTAKARKPHPCQSSTQPGRPALPV